MKKIAIIVLGYLLLSTNLGQAEEQDGLKWTSRKATVTGCLLVTPGTNAYYYVVDKLYGNVNLIGAGTYFPRPDHNGIMIRNIPPQVWSCFEQASRGFTTVTLTGTINHYDDGQDAFDMEKPLTCVVH